jgi:hypothetical protein
MVGPRARVPFLLPAFPEEMLKRGAEKSVSAAQPDIGFFFPTWQKKSAKK